MPSTRACLRAAMLVLVASVSALPTSTPSEDIAARDLGSDVTSSIASAASLAFGTVNGWTSPSAPSQKSALSCDLSSMKMPTTSSPMPAANGTLKYIALGRGTQNYTCSTSDASSTPASAGALANLYSMGCAASHAPMAAPLMSPIGLSMPRPDADFPNFLGMPLLGHHYFTPGSTPTFNLMTPGGDDGYVNAAVVAKVPAPQDAMAGQGGVGDGAVPWLALTQKPGPQGAQGQQTFQSVFRVATAGGNPPKTCQGMQKEFQVQYAAEYWFFQ